MSTISIRFRVPVLDTPTGAAPYVNFRCCDNRPPRFWRPCGHKHRTIETAKKCARSYAQGQTAGAVNERVEICGFVGKVEVVDGVRRVIPPKKLHA